MLANRDIGFVHAGQEAAIKVETFNFTRYGLIDGSVTSVSRDAVTNTSPPAPRERRRDDDKRRRAERRRAQICRAHRPRSDAHDDRGHEGQLTPGMAVTVEIKTGSRRIISYLLSPLERQGREALRER